MSDPDRPDISLVPDGATRPRRPRLKKLRLALILAGVGLLAMVSTAFGMMMAVASDLPDLESEAEFQTARNSVLTDVHGEFLGVLTSDQGRIIVRADDIALTMQNAIIAVEDRRFYENSGVDLRAIGRALYQDVAQRRAVQGGSTITQQFVKNATGTQDDRTVLQKVREAALAYHLNRKWSKEKILTQYLNSIYFGNGAYGIEAAARTYFGNDVNHQGCGPEGRRCAAELKPHEAALIAGVVASPSAYDPVANPRAAKRRRDLVLRNMREQGYLTAVELRRSVAESLPAERTVRPPQFRSVTESSAYFASWVRQQVVDRYSARRAFEGGLRVRTTLDLDVQRAAEQAVQQWLPAGSGGPTAAVVAIDNASGEVRAMVGGSDYSESPFNLATQGQRQPGSAFKPFVLATALREGVSADSTWESARQELPVPNSGGEEVFQVNNYEDAYSGVTTLARATTFSDNAVYAQVGIQVGVEKVAQTARRMGIRTPVSENPAMTLGGLREGVTPLDLAHAYESFATGGLRTSGTLATDDDGPVAIREVALRGERRRVLARNERRRDRVLPEPVAAQTTSILETVVRSGTATAASLGDVRVWGKTGTTENNADAWFVGATDSMTVAVWVGYPEGLRAMETEFRGGPVVGGTFPAEIWQDFMLTVTNGERERLQELCVDEERQDDERCIAAGLAPDPTAPVAPPGAVPEVPPVEGEPPVGEDGVAPPADGVPEPEPAPPAPEPEPAQPTPVPATPPPAAPVPEAGGAAPE